MNSRYIWQDICNQLNWEFFDQHKDNSWQKQLHKLYWDNEMSGAEIAKWINERTSDTTLITPRSIQRRLKLIGGCRTATEGYKLAASLGKVNWAYKDGKIKRRAISNAKRFRVFERDNNRCTICGATAKHDILELDHIIPVSQGGRDEEFNLRVLCSSCNAGKREANK